MTTMTENTEPTGTPAVVAPGITLGQIEEATSDLPLLGYTVFWALSGIRVTHTDLKSALDATDFGSYLPDLPTARIALRRAIVDWINQRAHSGQGPALAGISDEDVEDGPTTQRALLRVINQKGSDWMAFALIAEDVDFGKLGLRFGTNLRILLHKKSKAMICTSDSEGGADAAIESDQVTKELGPHWARYSDLHISGDLSRMMRNIVGGLGAIGLRREGGLYFVPISERDALTRLRILLSSLPHSATHAPYLCALGVVDRAQSRRQVAQAVHTSFLEELGVMRTDLQRFLDAKSGTVKAKTISERLSMYKKAKLRAQTYADLLGMQQERILEGIEDLTTLARTIVWSEAGSDDDGEEGSQIPFPGKQADAAA